MTNLWKETITKLANSGKTFADVRYIQNSKYQITKENFERIAKYTNYDSGYGIEYISPDLTLVGDDWWLERQEYDGAEWWEYKEKPARIPKYREITTSNEL